MTISGVEYLPDGRILIKTNIPSVLNFSDEVVTVYGAVQAGIESERELGFIEEADLVREPGTYTEYILRETDISKLKWVPRAGDLVYVGFRSPPIKNDYLARTYLTHIKFTTNYKYGVLSLALLMSSDYPTYRKYIFDGFDFMIEEVTEFVSELSDTLDQGLFAGMDMTGAFRNTDHEQINHFLRFVHERPFNYMSKSWKFSETYATWVLNKAPLSRAHYRDVLLDMDEKERSERLPYFEEQIANHLNDWFKRSEEFMAEYEYPSAISLSKLALDLAILQQDQKAQADLHLLRYEAYRGLNQDQRSSDELKAALEIYELIEDEQGIQLCRGMMEDLSTKDEVELVIQSGHNLPFMTAFHPSGKYFYTGGWDGFLKIWDTKSGLILTSVKAHSMMIEALEVSGDGRFVLTCMDDGKAKVFNARTLQLISEINFKTDYINNIDLNHEGSLIAYTKGDKHAYIYDVAEGKVIHKLKRHTKRVTDVRFGPQRNALDNLLYTCSMDSFVYTWNMPDFSPRGWYKDGTDLHGVVISPDVSLFATVRRDTSIGIWDFDTAATGNLTELNTNALKFYPNPAGDRFKVVNPWKHKSNYALLAIEGRIVQSGELRNGAQIVEVPGLTSGVHLFELRSESGRLTKKLVIR